MKLTIKIEGEIGLNSAVKVEFEIILPEEALSKEQQTIIKGALKIASINIGKAIKG